MQGNTKSKTFKIGEIVKVVGVDRTFEVIELKAHEVCVLRISGSTGKGFECSEWWIEPTVENISSSNNQ